MKTTRFLILLFLAILYSLPFDSLSQGRGHRHKGGRKSQRNGHRHQHHGIVHKSRFRPKVLVVYHPIWAPGIAYQRRWVFFPRYNFYWDNWRNVYFFQSGTAWISQTSVPKSASNSNLESEKKFELNENEEEIDAIYSNNADHQRQYKVD